MSAPALSQTLAREFGGEWKAGQGLVYTAPGKGLMFRIHYASCQQPQGVVLERYASWMRPMAIIWAANGWTVVSDAEAWTLDRAKVLKLVAILEKTRPDYETWKTARETADEADKPERR